MYYEENEARQLVIAAGNRLLETGLIARTWGNISARISKEEFIITPSGMAYDTLTPEKLVKVKCQDLSYEGDIKPSSEKGIHAIAYILRPEISFIIHTHQFYASVVGIEGRDIGNAAAAEYALPGTDKLRDKMMHCISKHPDMKAFLMQKHGALCLGESLEDAFAVAASLENDCKTVFELYIKETDYLKAAARQKKTIKPYIDDFAQILGTSVNIQRDIDEICDGEDAEAQKMILEKNCAAALFAGAKKVRPLSFADASLQRMVYLTKYSKLKDE